MKKEYLSIVFFIVLRIVHSQQWSGPDNTSDLITRTGETEASVFTAKKSSSPAFNFLRNESSISNGSVIGQINFRGPSHYGGLIVARSVGAWGAGWQQAGTRLEFWTQDNTTNANLDVRMAVDHNGNVGIGTTSPSFKMSIGSGSGDTSSALQINTDDSDKILLSRYGSAGSRISMSSGWTTEYKAGQGLTTKQGNHVFYTSTSSGYKERLRINDDGNVGIGTASPNARLTVSMAGAGVISRFKSTANGGISGLRLEGKSNDGSDVRFLDIAYDPETYSYGFGAGSYSGVLPISSGLDKSDIVVNGNGFVGIGTANPDEQLTVNGTIHSEEVKVDLSVPGPDYVFEEDYNLRTLEETEAYIKENKHLPEIPSAGEMETNGVQLGEMNMLLLKKIEELTLYTIEQQKMIEAQGAMIEELQERIKEN